MNTQPGTRTWRLRRGERIGVLAALGVILAFGVNLEFRTALHRTPMTDLGVFACAAGAVRAGENPYMVTDWHGWHYHYPPAFAILFTPLAQPVPTAPPPRAPGELRTAANTPWGYNIDSPDKFYGLNGHNERFFWIVAVWYVVSVALVLFAVHALACALEGARLSEPPPGEPGARRRWWARRVLPLLVCLTSVGTDLSRGQVDIMMLAAIALGLYLAASRREFRAGVALAFPATVKLFPPLLLLYPAWRWRGRMVLGVLAGLVVFLLVIPAVTLGPGRTVELYRLWVDVLAKPALGQGADTSRARELTGMGATDNQSLLVFIHNWRHHALPREERPPAAAAADRYAVYAVGAVMLLGIGAVAGLRRRDGPQELLILAGLLIGLTFVVSPIVHNFYYLVALPLIAGLVDHCLGNRTGAMKRRGIVTVLVLFTLVDILARLPGVGPWLRDWGAPLLTLFALMVAGAVVLFRGGRVHEPAASSRAGLETGAPN